MSASRATRPGPRDAPLPAGAAGPAALGKGGARTVPAVRPWTDLAVRKVSGAETRSAPDRVASEEPLEVRIRRAPWTGATEERVAVTMRTPGDDFDLAAGFLYTEGLLRSASDLAGVSFCTPPASEQYGNVVTVDLAEASDFDARWLQRNFYATSSCGVCGKASLEALEVRDAPLPASAPFPDASVLRGLPARLRGAQEVFERTGGLHAAALFSMAGELRALREDVGRHNAVDKVVGHLLREGRLPPRDGILPGVLLVSGRASFEILQKALAARLACVAAIGAPSSLAVDVARRFGIALVGFLKPEGFNVYHPAEE